ncbi:MAG: hypothetical protein WC248_01970 [Candidatus Methanomethylophilaceae archaeon]|jgi:hypothetical protein
MGISIAICELEAKSASCRELKKDVKKVLLKDISGFENAAESDEVISLEEARKAIPDWDGFLKRNRINEETDAVYMDKVKDDNDVLILSKLTKREYTGWIDFSKLDNDGKKSALDKANREDRVTGWDELSFDEMNNTCKNCPLSWDKGRGCIGAFGPDNSVLPEIAAKRICPIVASVPEGVKTGRKYTPEEGMKLIKEVEILNAALPEEGKIMIRRYSGPLERLAAVAKISVDENCGFFFF